ncbi:MAG: hypothetical protein WDK95_10855 [Syntrophorhabdaceae bacterium]
MKNKVLQVFEHQTLKVQENSLFEKKHFLALEKYGYKTNEKYYYVGNERIKFSSYVGAIQVDNLTIEILPKADYDEVNERSKEKWHNALITMLGECKLIKLNAISNAKLKLRSASILDLYYDFFLTEVEKIYKRGLQKSYRPVQQNLNKIKGKIIFTEHIRKNAFHKENFYVEHQLYDKNNKFNQILYKAIMILSRITNNSDFTVRIKKLLLNMEGISEENVSAGWFENLSYNRNTERYREALMLAKLIILRFSPDLKGGKENVLAILFDMNTLYENYIYRKLKVIQNDPDIPIISVKEQSRKPFWESRGIRADILIESENSNIVIDTKWKILRDNKPSDSDLKQMFVYNLYYDSDLSILLYPKTSLDTINKKPYKHELYQHKHCQVAFVDLFRENKLNKNIGNVIYHELLENEVLKN